jgi:hypothetical protein
MNMAQYNYDPNSLGKDFASYNAFGDVNQKTSDMYRNFVGNNSTLFDAVGGTGGFDNYMKERGASLGWNSEALGDFQFSDNSKKFGATLEDALKGFTRSRTGYAGMDDGRINLLRDASGNIVSNSSPYSYDPAKETLTEVMKGIALQLAVAGGASALGGSGGVGSTAVMPGEFGGLELAGNGLAGGAGTAAGSPYALSGGSFGTSGAIGSTSLTSAGAGLVPTTGALAEGGGILGGALATAGGAGTGLSALLGDIAKSNTGQSIVKNLVGGNKNSGGSGGFDLGSLLQNIAQIYQGNRQQESAKGLYDSLASQFGPDSAYAKQLRQELDRRDAASGRRSQYGPREVELQAKLADQMTKNLTTMTALMDKSNSGLTSQLQAGLKLGEDSGLSSIFGDAIKGIGSDIWKDFKGSDFYKDLFDWGD